MYLGEYHICAKLYQKMYNINMYLSYPKREDFNIINSSESAVFNDKNFIAIDYNP